LPAAALKLLSVAIKLPLFIMKLNTAIVNCLSLRKIVYG
jgi:hypothetical protein